MQSVEIAVRVTARARANEIAGERDGVVLVRVSAPPEDGRANAAACRVIANWMGVRPSGVTIVRGARSREKVVRVVGVSADELRRLIGR